MKNNALYTEQVGFFFPLYVVPGMFQELEKVSFESLKICPSERSTQYLLCDLLKACDSYSFFLWERINMFKGVQ